ncbi:membrane protein [Methylobacterium sp. 10]|uniref:membrane protein n=1 Tax=Methylobacterium sp. 10 TaxID=1101191 RepID=UPI0004810A42|nr:membrane protein [Methylobacterium sp. 10]
MKQFLGIGIGAGLVSALLFGVLLKGTLLSIVLYLLAPLPILIVGLGWSHKAALVAAITGAVALAFLQPFLGLGYLAYLALPAWWLAYLTLLGRPNADGTMEWYPTGRLLAWTACTAGIAFVAIAVIASPSFDTFQTQLRGMTRTLVTMQGKPRATPPAAAPAEKSPAETTPVPPAELDANAAPSTESGTDQQNAVADALATIAPGLATQGLAVLLTFYLWAAARIVRISGRLPRPWPDIPSTAMPRSALGILGAAVVLALVPGYPGVLGIALIGALTAAFAMQGLAAFHDRSRGRPGRMALLFGLYLILFFTQGVALFALTLFGLADTAFNRRRPKEDAGRT